MRKTSKFQKERRRKHRGPRYKLAAYWGLRGILTAIFLPPYLAFEWPAMGILWVIDKMARQLHKVERWAYPGYYGDPTPTDAGE